MIKIITDSTADFTLEEAKKFDIGILPMMIAINEKSYLDKIDISTRQFYELLKTTFPKTSQPSIGMTEEIINKYRDEKDGILIITVSSKLSGTYGGTKLVIEDSGLNNIELVDSRNVSCALKQLVYKAIELRDKGKSLREIKNEIEKFKEKTKLLISLETLENLHRGGRISKLSLFTGSLIKLKPILEIKDGALASLKSVRGTNNSINFILEKLDSEEVDKNFPLIIGYSADESKAFIVKEKLENKGFKIRELLEIGPTVGAHTGPNGVIVSYVVK